MPYKKQTKNTLKYGNVFNEESIRYYRKHIIAFVEDVIFKNDPSFVLSKQQKDFLLSIQNEDRVAAKSGKGVGKTATIAYAIIWFLCCFDNPKIICTAPSYPTLKSALWPEVALWLNKSLVKDIFTHTEERLYLTESPKNWWAEPRTAKDKENMQGLHAPNMLVIADEASAIKQDIFDALDTTLTGSNNKFIMIGNPTQVVGPFFDCFNRYSKKWCLKTYNAEESPIVKPGQIEYYAEKYGKHHDLYLVNVLGEFPSGSPNAFIKLSDVHQAVQRHDDIQYIGDIEIGIDVARFGDDLTVLYWRQGWKVSPAKTLAKNTVPEAVALVLETVESIRKKTGYDKTIKVKVDDTGVGGGVTDLLNLDRTHNIEVIPCNFGGKGNDTYQNEASVMWGKVKDYISFIGIPDDTHLIEELSSRRWCMSNTGKIMIESKKEYKKEFKSSPDRADALILCFASKTNDNSILKNFDPLDNRIVIKNYSYSGSIKNAGLFYSKDLFVSLIYTAYDNKNLYIYDEFVGDDSLPLIATNILQHANLTSVIGNDRLFSKESKDLAYKYRRFHINIHENYQYNELSSIDSLVNMVNMKQLIVNENCKKTIEQLRNWRLDGNKNDLERNYGLCYALLHIISTIKKKNIYNNFQNNSYGYVNEQPKKKINYWNDI